MTMMNVISLKDLADRLGGRLAGPPDLMIYGVGDLTQATQDQISFIGDKKYLPMLANCAARAIVTRDDIDVSPRPAIILDKPGLAFAKMLDIFAPPMPKIEKGVHPSAVVKSKLDASVCVGANVYIDENVTIGGNTIIHPNVYIGPDVRIGRDCLIWPGVVIRERVVIGDRVIIHPNAVIGGDGFGFNFINGKHCKVTHIGTVVIEDDVEIGSCTCIDRAKAGATVIGAGTKIDNLVQIGHNVKVGQNSILISQVGIAGSVNIGRNVTLAGQVGVRDNINIGDGVQVTGCSVVTKSVSPGRVVSGDPAQDNTDFLRQQAIVRKLPELYKTIMDLTKRIHELEQTIHNSERSGD
jgi:UDP-3-O-[3-hydroxymyristoyl] glucosamine N-acyltransferase